MVSQGCRLHQRTSDVVDSFGVINYALFLNMITAITSRLSISLNAANSLLLATGTSFTQYVHRHF